MERYNLVESDGKLLLVALTRHKSSIGNNKVEFQIFEVNLSNDGERIMRLTKVEGLGNRAIFIGLDDSSFCMEAYPISKCKPNSIYFIDQSYDGYLYDKSELKIYNIDDGSVERLYRRFATNTTRKCWDCHHLFSTNKNGVNFNTNLTPYTTKRVLVSKQLQSGDVIA